MLHFVTSANGPYLAKALCLRESFRAQRSAGTFWFFALDSQAATAMSQLGGSDGIVVAESDYDTPELQAVRAVRSPLEYACTTKPIFLQHVMKHAGAGNWVFWLDGDMFFFQPAERIVPAGAASVLLTPHRFTPAFAALGPSVGMFNAGFAGFRKTSAGQRALAWWAERCLEWCGAVPDGKRYTDQKYLDEMPALFDEVADAAPGVNAAPWNSVESETEMDGTMPGTALQIGGHPLILYHFQGLRVLHRRCYDLYADDRLRLPAELRRLVYRPYVRALRQASQRVDAVLGNLRREHPARSLLRVAKRVLLRRGNLAFI